MRHVAQKLIKKKLV